MTMESSHVDAKPYLIAADEAMEAARVPLDRRLLTAAINRAYYAMFYAAQAALVSQQVPLPKRHATVVNLFYRHFVQPGKVPGGLHRDLANSLQLRQQSDYEIHARIGEGEVRETVEKAETFVARIKHLLGVA